MANSDRMEKTKRVRRSGCVHCGIPKSNGGCGFLFLFLFLFLFWVLGTLGANGGLGAYGVGGFFPLVFGLGLRDRIISRIK